MTKEQFEFNYVTAKCELSRADIIILQCGIKALKFEEYAKDLLERLEKTDKELEEALKKIDQTIG